jgi:hypothetical protein
MQVSFHNTEVLPPINKEDILILSLHMHCCLSSMAMVFNATFNHFSVLSWRSVLLVEDTEVPGENHRPVTSH